MRFMSSILDNLVKNLPKEKMIHLKKLFPDDAERELMTRKGVFCYDYLDDLKKLDETCLPPKNKFRNRLTGEDISDEDYAHAQNNLMLLRRIGKSNPRARKALLKNVDKDMVQCICECAHNTIYSNVPVTKPQFKKLSRHKRLLRQLAKKGESWKKKKKVILRQS
ncbi:hypothetical protein B566_EDAN016140, partial [Ephemera danica]